MHDVTKLWLTMINLCETYLCVNVFVACCVYKILYEFRKLLFQNCDEDYKSVQRKKKWRVGRQERRRFIVFVYTDFNLILKSSLLLYWVCSFCVNIILRSRRDLYSFISTFQVFLFVPHKELFIELLATVLNCE